MFPLLVAILSVVSAVAVSEPIKPVPENAEDAAAQFWSEYVSLSGNYDFHLDEVIEAASADSLADLPEIAASEIRNAVEHCVAMAEEFESQVAKLLVQSYDLEELIQLRDLLGTEFGRRHIVKSTKWDGVTAEKSETTKSYRKLVRDVVDSGLAKKYIEGRSDLFTAINQLADPAAEYRDQVFPNTVFNAREPYDGDSVFSGSLEQRDDGAILRLFVEPLDGVASYLQRNGIVESPLGEEAVKNKKRFGDQVVALVSFGKGGLDAQWIVKVESVEKTDPEVARSSNTVNLTRYTSFGNSYEFQTKVEAFAIQLIGPFEVKDGSDPDFEPKVSEFRILLKGDFLELKLYEAAAFIERFSQYLHAESLSGKGLVNGSSKPFDEAQIAKTKQVLGGMKVTAQEERAYVGSILSYWEFFQIIAKTPQLRGILFKVAKLSPLSYFKFKKHGVAISYPSDYFEKLDPIKPLGELPVYSYPIRFSIDSKQILLTRLIVTEPFAPLRNVAGIYGLVAAPPDDPTKRVVVRVLSVKRGEIDVTEE